MTIKTTRVVHLHLDQGKDTSPRKEDKRGNSSSSTKEENGKVVIQLDKVERESETSVTDI